MQAQEVELKPIQEELNGELSEIIYYECQFCQKNVGLRSHQRKICERLSGQQFYCNYCLQNNLNTKNNRHILIMSFKPILGFYFYSMYIDKKKLYLSQIMDYLKMHEFAGLQNPLFRYDPDSLLWFVDFSKVGRGKRKLPISEVLKTVVNILACFELPRNINNFSTSRIYDKYNEAIMKFHSNRYRPLNRKILIPTLNTCGGLCDNKNFDHEATKKFRRLFLD
ncbi:MAG: hypothetical protein DWQ19_11930 [Crenarchaeota archaeon]|nr:MAG: hypothetical protein DWQ19_11930 [Thermoproteota archaeon]